MKPPDTFSTLKKPHVDVTSPEMSTHNNNINFFCKENKIIGKQNNQLWWEVATVSTSRPIGVSVECKATGTNETNESVKHKQKTFYVFQKCIYFKWWPHSQL